ncbi:MAG: hypothetical protein ACK5NK_05055 [Niabella sp.]
MSFFNLSEQMKAASMTSDKMTYHGYHRFYPLFIHTLVDVPNIKMLELGYQNGYSIDLWTNYFNNPIIDAIDVLQDPNDNRLNKYFLLDQSKNSLLDDFVNNSETKYDFIIDDASHVPDHQWNTFIRFINILKDGGIYIIEDVETSYWKRGEIFGYQFNANKTSIFNRLKIIADFINYEFTTGDLVRKYKLSVIEAEALMQIEMVTLGYNCIVIVKKDTALFNDFYRTRNQYRHTMKINRKDVSSFEKIKIFIRSLIK